MDEARKIRFLYPPALLALALSLAGKLDPEWSLRGWLRGIGSDSALENLGIAATLGLALVTVGYAIGTCSVFVLRLLALLPFVPNYESALSRDRYEDVWRNHLGGMDGVDESDGPYLTAAFDHGALSRGHKDWIDRRWNAFNLSMHSAVALLLAIPLVHLCDFDPGSRWYLAVGLASAMFVFCAGLARYDTRRMNDMLARTSRRSTSKDECE